MTLPANTSYCFPYVRVSSERQYASGISAKEQLRQLREYYDRVLAHEGVLWAGDYADDDEELIGEGISASKVDFCDRPVGGEINRRARKGDHIIVAKVDRIFRDWADAGMCIRHWKQRGVICHVLEFNVRTDGDPMHTELMLAMGTSFAAATARRIGQWSRESKATLRAMGCGWGKNPPTGFTFIRRQFGRNTHLALVPDKEQRKIINRIVTLYKDHTRTEVLHIMRAEGAKLPVTTVRGVKGAVVRKLVPVSPDDVWRIAYKHRESQAAWPDEMDANGLWLIPSGQLRVVSEGEPLYKRVAEAKARRLSAADSA